jgi:hypothetical protein
MIRNLMRKLSLAILVLTVSSVVALAADFSSKWTAEIQGPRGTQLSEHEIPREEQ